MGVAIEGEGGFFSDLVEIIEAFPGTHGETALIGVSFMSGLSDFGYFAALWRIRRLEFGVAVATIVGVLALGVLAGAIVGVLLSLVIVVDHIGRPPTSFQVLVDDGELSEVEGPSSIPSGASVVVWRPQAPLIYLNARRLSSRVREFVDNAAELSILIIDCAAMSDVDSTATSLFSDVQRDLGERDIEFWISGASDETWARVTAGLRAMGRQVPRRFETLDEAVAQLIAPRD